MAKKAAGRGHKGAFVTVAFLLVYTSLTHIDWQLVFDVKYASRGMNKLGPNLGKAPTPGTFLSVSLATN